MSAFKKNKLGAAVEIALQEKTKEYLPYVHFNHEECLTLLKMYQRLNDIELLDRLRFRSFCYAALKITDGFMLDRVYRMADKDDNGYINAQEWMISLSTMLRGTLDELIEFCYNVYDINGDRSISRDELYMLFGEAYKPRGDFDNEEVEEAIKDLVEMAMQTLDRDKDGVISFCDYRASIHRNPLLLQCCGICLPPSQAMKGFQATYTHSYHNFTTFTEAHESWKRVPKSTNAMRTVADLKHLAHRKISDVTLPPSTTPGATKTEVFLLPVASTFAIHAHQNQVDKLESTIGLTTFSLKTAVHI